ncbi:YvcK family protein [Patescibacteria group bacterium]|nr:YvcK family protein [Patescibacteria group bacterium]
MITQSSALDARLRIVCLGGGTGTYCVLRGLREHPVDLSAVVSIADNGGSSGMLRDQYGVLPPGDLRNAMSALAPDPDIQEMLRFRFTTGGMKGHTLGNVLLTGLEQITGDPLRGLRMAHKLFQLKGRVIPVATRAANLLAELMDGKILDSETVIDQPTSDRSPIRRCYLDPPVQANPEALEAISEADIIVIGPGDLYTSLVPVLLVGGVASAIRDSKAMCMYVLNLATRRGQTTGYSGRNFCDTLAAYIAPGRIDRVLINDAKPSPEVVARYVEAGEGLVINDLSSAPYTVWSGPLISDEIARPEAGDPLVRSLFRHDSAKLASAILETYAVWNEGHVL